MWLGADPEGNPTPIQSYGVAISHNTINQADGLGNGAITMSLGWYAGPSPGTWDFAESPLIFNNAISNIDGPPPSVNTPWTNCPNSEWARVGINVNTSEVWHAVLAQNSCTSVTQNLWDVATRSKRVCTNAGATSCECSYYVQGAESVTTASQSSGSISYTSAENKGDTNLVIINWSGTGVGISSVTDGANNTYRLVGGAEVIPAGTFSLPSDVHQAIYFAPNIASASSNMVTVAFNGAATDTTLRVLEYQGLDPNEPVDVAIARYGNNVSLNSGFVTPTDGNDLLVSVDFAQSTGIAASAGNTVRLIRTDPILGSDMVEDSTVSTIAAYGTSAVATAP